MHYENIEDNKILFVGQRLENVSVFNLNDLNKHGVKHFSAISDNSWLWHRHLGHAHMGAISKLSIKELVVGLPKINYVIEHNQNQ